MWFKNLRVYRLLEPLVPNVAQGLASKPFEPCGSLDPLRYGFVPPIEGSSQLLHTVLSCDMICAKRQEKILPSAAVNEALEEKVRAISKAESRSVGRKERATLKDEIIFTMLPKALTKSTLEYAYVDRKSRLIVVNASSAKKAEDLLSKLREALGTLRCVPLSVKLSVPKILTHMVQTGETPKGFELGSDIELRAGNDRRVVRCKDQDLSADEVHHHIEAGMFVNKLALTWNEHVHFSIDTDLAIKGVKFEDVIMDRANERNPETRAEQFDADFAIMSELLRPFLDELTGAFGGMGDK